MLIIDDILLFPLTGVLWVFKKIDNAARQDLVNEAEAITNHLSELYMMLETDRITEAEFDSRESELLDRLEELESGKSQFDGQEDNQTEGDTEEQ